jgi:predicted permease
MMAMLSRAIGGIRALLRRKAVEAELDEELRGYLDIAVGQKMATGMSRTQALRAARVEMGSVEALKDRIRDVGWESLVETLWQDVRYAVRALRKSPGFTAVAVASLALGIGANTAVFTFLNALLWRPLPVSRPWELVQLGTLPRRSFISFPIYLDLRAGQQVFTDVAATQFERLVRLTISGAGGQTIELDNVPVGPATGNYFEVLGIRPAVGRFFTPEDDRHPNSSETTGSVIVLSDAFWSRQFGRDPQVVGGTILVDRSPCRVIGVAPRGFIGERVGSAPDAWVPLIPFNIPNNLEGRRGTFTAEIARLKPGVDRKRAQTMMTTMFQQLLKSEGIVQDGITRYGIVLVPAGGGIDSGVRIRYVTPLGIAMAIAMLVLLIACANVANLLIARGARRHGEIGVRLAIGCSRGRLVRQLLTESLVLSASGAAAGIVVAYWGTQSLLQMVNAGQVPIRLDVTPDGRVLLFLTAVALLTGVGFGMLPALRASRLDPSPSLRGSGGGSGGVSRQRLSRVLVSVQVALSLLLLISAGLLVESFRNLHAIEWGFRPDQVAVFDLRHNPRNSEPSALAGVAADIERRVRALPGVESASVSWILLFGSRDQRTALQIPGYVPPPEDSARFSFIDENVVMVRYNPVSPGYFATVGMTLIEGRGIEEGDRPGAPLVAVINESLARRYFAAGRAVGRTFVMIAGPARRDPVQVVGVVRDAKYNNLRDDVIPMFYAPIAQMPRELHGLEVRTRGPLPALAGSIRQAIADVTKDVMIQRVVTLTDQVDHSLAADRLMMRLSTFFGMVALLLACVGLYGVLAYQVAQRIPEIGIRLALGATRAGIINLVLGETAAVVAAGIILGVALALSTTRLLATFLFGLTPRDPATVALATALLVGSAALAAYLPSRNAAGVDPNVALRYE